MDDYISKQSVIDYLKGYFNSIGECGADSLLFDRGQRRALINSIQDISVIKGADVQPVKRGRWIENSDPGQNINEHYMCSECGCTFHNWANDNYCPNCGARMEGDSE